MDEGLVLAESRALRIGLTTGPIAIPEAGADVVVMSRHITNDNRD